MSSTPFIRGITMSDTTASIDAARLASHGTDVIRLGCVGVSVFGTTGEGPSIGISERAAAYGFPGVRVDGMKVDDTYRAAVEAVERARAGGRAAGASKRFNRVYSCSHPCGSHTKDDSSGQRNAKGEQQHRHGRRCVDGYACRVANPRECKLQNELRTHECDY